MINTYSKPFSNSGNTIIDFDTFPVRSVLRDGISSMEDLFIVGEFLDDLDACIGNQSLERKAKKLAKAFIGIEIRSGNQIEISKVCGRSWTLNDIWNRVLNQMEDLRNVRGGHALRKAS